MFYDPEVTIFEGGGISIADADCRDHHLGPELGGFEDLKFGHTDVRAFPLSAETAFVMAEYHLQTRYKERDIDVTGLSTLFLVRKNESMENTPFAHVEPEAARKPVSSSVD